MLSKSMIAMAACMLTLAGAAPLEKAPTRVQERDCPTYAVYVRGTDPTMTGQANDPNPSDSVLANIASSGVPAATVTALAYPASGIADPSEYGTSWGTGIDHLQGLLKYYYQTCSGTKVVLLGYSQGASVVAGALYGGLGRPVLDQDLLDMVVGGVVFADPSFVAGLQPLNGPSSDTTVNGSAPQGDVQQQLNTYKGKIFRSYCEAGDAYCANAGSSGGTIHENEETFWESDAISFLQSLNI